jgi:hypothetical protein
MFNKQASPKFPVKYGDREKQGRETENTLTTS